jgi:tRNA pseudouridine38-40 synthase
LQKSLNALLTPHICIFDITPLANTDLIHRKQKVKTYRYQIFNAPYAPVFNTNYYWFVPKNLDIEKMKLATKDLIGVKDFAAFRNKGCGAKTTKRNLLSIEFEIIQRQKAKQILLYFKGDGFLKQMVRNIVGTLVDIGLGKKKQEVFQQCFEKNASRKILGKTAPASALFLEKIEFYEEH